MLSQRKGLREQVASRFGADRGLVLRGLILLVSFLGGCGFGELSELLVPDVSCEGVCPPPSVGLVTNTIALEKSVWLDEPRIGLTQSDQFVFRSLCLAEARAAQGQEILFRGEDGLAVVAHEQGVPSETVFFGSENFNSIYSELLDLDGDGNAEYWNTSDPPELRNEDGSLRWTWSDDPDLVTLLTTFDLNGDGIFELAVQYGNSVFAILTADGAELFRTPEDVYLVAGADVDGDGQLEVVTMSPISTPESRVRIITREPDGTVLGSFESSTTLQIVRNPEDSSRDYIGLSFDCGIYYDVDGTKVADTPQDQFGNCLLEPIEHQTANVETDCDQEKLDVPVRFYTDKPPFRAEIAYSLRFVNFLFGAPRTGGVFRTIIRVYEPSAAGDSETLVYDEVIENTNGMGSYAVIPGVIAGMEILLIADDTRVLAYQPQIR